MEEAVKLIKIGYSNLYISNVLKIPLRVIQNFKHRNKEICKPDNNHSSSEFHLLKLYEELERNEQNAKKTA